MKTLEKIVLITYSYIVLILAIITSLVMFGWLDSNMVGSIIMQLLNDDVIAKIILVMNAIFCILSIKYIFFGTSTKNVEAPGILLQNENGKLMISKETIENLVTTIVAKFESVSGASSAIILDKENKLIISLNLTVKENVIIKELSSNLQEKIKAVIKETLDLDVKEVNIKIKNYQENKDNA